MSLNIYTLKEDIPGNVDYVRGNDLFFDSYTLKDDDITKTVLMDIDKAEYHSPTTFIGRDTGLGALNKNLLSTGCKTVLNVIYNPDKCFDVIECGQNALSLIRYIRQGNILWKYPVLFRNFDSVCDIDMYGRKFTDFREFIHYIDDVWPEE